MKIDKIKDRNDLFQVIKRKIVKAREKVVRKLRSRFLGLNEKSFRPFEIEASTISEKTIVPQSAFNAVISRRDVRKLNGTEADGFEFNEGTTTVAHMLDFFFPPKNESLKDKRNKRR